MNRVVFSIARSLDPTPFWLELLERGEEPEPLRLGWVPRERLFISERPEDMEPAHAVGNLALWSIVRSDEPATMLSHLTDFVRLPPLIQEVLGGTAIAPHLRTLAVGNADRVEHLFRESSSELRWLIQYMRDSSLCLVVSHVGVPGVGRDAFDLEFRVTGTRVTDWQSATIFCERGLRDPGGRPGLPRPLGELSGLSDLFASV